jgi:hypothetical protein
LECGGRNRRAIRLAKNGRLQVVPIEQRWRGLVVKRWVAVRSQKGFVILSEVFGAKNL